MVTLAKQHIFFSFFFKGTSCCKKSILGTHIHFILTDFSNRKKCHKISLVHNHTPKTSQRKTSEEKQDVPTGWEQKWQLVDNFWESVVILQVGKDVVGVFAAEVAEAGLDPHHLPCESRPIRTLELNVDGFGLVRYAAALVCADTAVLGLVQLLAGAARDGEVWGQLFSVDVQTFLSRLMEEWSRQM